MYRRKTGGWCLAVDRPELPEPEAPYHRVDKAQLDVRKGFRTRVAVHGRLGSNTLTTVYYLSDRMGEFAGNFLKQRWDPNDLR